MKTYEQENESFISEYADFIDAYNASNNCYLDSDLNDLYKSIIARRKVSPGAFFREVRAVVQTLGDGYTDIDIINYINCAFSDNNYQHSLLQDYFDDVKYIYDNLPGDELEFTEENRENILNSNLKMVISTAKRYQNRGMSLEDLIGAGNVGLCIAWDRYKPEHNVLRNKILEELKACPDEVSLDYVDNLLNPFVRYGDLKEKYDKYFHSKRIYTREEVTKWVTKNIKKAKFSSVAALWIRAYILQELNGNSRIVKKPKSEIDKDLEMYGRYVKESVVSLDPLIDIDDKSNISTKVELSESDNVDEDIDERENMISFKMKLNKLLVGINNRDRRILFKSFGIGLPRSMEPREISEVEGLSVARVSQIILDSVGKMKNNAAEQGIEMEDLLKYLR